MIVPQFTSTEAEARWFFEHQEELAERVAVNRSKYQRKIVLPSLRERRFKKFKHIWEEMDEEFKEVIAGALFVLNHKPVGRPEAVKLVKESFDDYRTELLETMAQYVEEQ